MTRLRGKTALVTNASRAPGKAAAIALADAGARVLIHDLHSTANVARIVEAIVSAGGIARAAVADVATADGANQLARVVRAVIGDRLDILVVDADAVESGAALPLIELLLPILNSGSSAIVLELQS
ncbi:SDR family NAD(P)-dependent oxidoreductase [Steroidobacter sp. S1-65]|uniref:SDR family NAD(P)-dependent oxidoreductase n=1 Tax=Steroidobacter gossypii TaxID=2805490 RepID=A0ABS1X087_9GAMM|nr:SDR family NAD(P)-dependent oxidoreductase [Steroidobacter gossypii]MBM0106626.1 SDR family NAD(P)-dependent oxidoreductase [Steroidobacter gossypii]